MRYFPEIAAPSLPPCIGAVVTTYCRSWALRRTLHSLAKQLPIMVVDDKSDPLSALRNRLTARRHGASYLLFGNNLGLAQALNAGIGYWLSRPETEWISVFNDDIEAMPDSVIAIDEIARASPFGRDATLVTGYRSPHHSAHGETRVAGRDVLLLRSASGQHLHAHRSYWQRVLPIPSPYAAAPKRNGGAYDGQGSDTDWWIGSWAPGSAVKRGAYILCAPGLVTTFGAGRSTWGSSGL
ncbi:MAG: glycosyltransferase family 2 protein [Rhodospirillales bacterium]|nr:glycosyltransferase family 2 protein [Rhodospirillales bacterium]